MATTHTGSITGYKISIGTVTHEYNELKDCKSIFDLYIFLMGLQTHIESITTKNTTQLTTPIITKFYTELAEYTKDSKGRELARVLDSNDDLIGQNALRLYSKSITTAGAIADGTEYTESEPIPSEEDGTTTELPKKKKKKKRSV